MRFEIETTPLDSFALSNTMCNPQAGGFATFEGWVRNHNEGQSVVALEYEAYESMAEQEGLQIIAEAMEKFDILEARCVHRVGQLAIGEMAVWVGVAAAHRKEAFRACEYIIDEVKHRVPIWKKEYYTNGDSGWVNCEQCAGRPHEHSAGILAEEFYARQLCLPDIGPEGQERLSQSRVLVVGAGGLGCPALLYLTAAGVGTLGICDGDVVDVSNLHRQVLFTTADIGKPKAHAALEHLKAHNPLVTFKSHEVHLTPENAMDLFSGYDLVLDCTDNFTAKFLMNDAAILSRTPLLQASIYQYEGQLQVVSPDTETACLRCLWPRMPEPGCVGSCAEVGVFGAVAGLFGTLQAVEALKYCLKFPDALSGDTMLTLNLLNYEMNRIQKPRDPDCPLCGTAPSLTAIDARWYCQPTHQDGVVDVTDIQLSDYCLVDIREPHEREQDPLTGVVALEIPLSRFSQDSVSVLQDGQNYLLVCSAGVRSAYLARSLRAQGNSRFYSLKQGISALRTHNLVTPLKV